MENKQTITEVKKGDTPTLLHAWKANELIEALNKQWVVELPPDSGSATFKDSPQKVTLDLTKVNFGNSFDLSNILTDNIGDGEGSILIEPPTVDEEAETVTIQARTIKQGTGITVTENSEDITIDCTVVGVPSPPGSGTYVLGSVDGSLTWLSTTSGCP